MALPRPPRPPFATIALCPSSVKSAKISPVAASLTSVPCGTFITQSSAPRPNCFLTSPDPPFSAVNLRLNLNFNSVLTFSSTSRTMSPPLPPSPPSGPPLGTNFSRRKEDFPLPPLPACTLILLLSMNCILIP